MTERTISMKAKSIPLILSGDEDVSRRLKKEGEFLSTKFEAVYTTEPEYKEYSDFKDFKFMVGKVYPIVDENEEPVWYCPKCMKEAKIVWINEDKIANFRECGCCVCSTISDNCKLLKIKVLSIKEEKLLDITEDDAKKEGFKTKVEFLFEFAGCYKDDIPKHLKNSKKEQDKTGTNWIRHEQIKAWNPAVWRIGFEVVE